MAFSIKMSRACPGMLSSENDDFKFLKTAKDIKCMCITCKIINVTVAKELYYIFSKYRNFNTGNFSFTLSIYSKIELEQSVKEMLCRT